MNKYTLVTGATSGIGKALVEGLSEESNLVLLGRSRDKLEAVLENCNMSDKHKMICCDLNLDKSKIYQLINGFLLEEKVEIEAFVHCAGMTRILPFRNFSGEYVEEIFNVNLFSCIEILRALLKKNNHNSLRNIVLISSLWSMRGEVGNSIYASSKGAINSLVYSLAKELSPKVKVNAILPGAIKTSMTRELLESEVGLKQLKDYPLGFGECSDVIHVIRFLLSEQSRWMTGQTIHVDGGRSIL